MKNFYIIEIITDKPFMNIYKIQAKDKSNASDIYEEEYETTSSQWIVISEQEFKSIKFKVQTR